MCWVWNSKIVTISECSKGGMEGCRVENKIQALEIRTGTAEVRKGERSGRATLLSEGRCK